MINYYYSSDEFLEAVKFNRFQNKKVLFTFGDSWTNNNYLNFYKTYPQKCWSYQLAEKLQYDGVVNISTNGGSNEEIFKYCLDTMCLYEDYTFEKCEIQNIGATEIKVVIGWSSQLRTFDALHNLFRPYNVSSIPFVTDQITPFQTLYKTYVHHLHKEYYCFKTQMQTIALQHYFARHNIESFYFMAFTPLLESDLMNTKWDLRSDIDASRFYKLFEEANNMSNTLNERCESLEKHEHIIETSMLYIDHLKSHFSKLLNKKLSSFTTPHPRYFLPDGHPNEVGLEVIADELFTLINNSVR